MTHPSEAAARILATEDPPTGPAPDADALGLTNLGRVDSGATTSATTPTPSTIDRFEPSRVRFDDEFWKATNEDDWLIEPIIPRARLTALVGGPKTGKSLLMLDLAASVATGRSLLGEQAGQRRRVLYADLEMTPADLRERLVDMGYGPGDDFSHLVYYALPALPPLDTPTGGAELVELATANAVELVVIDTTSRVIEGDENDAGTFANMYRYTFAPLKALGIAVVRLDHTGHENSNRARGSSAKAADVDLIWSLTSTDNGVRLERTHQRISWAPDKVQLRRIEDPLRHEVVLDDWPAGTAETVKLLASLDVDPAASVNVAMQALRDSGNGRRKQVVAAAQRYRRSGPAAPIGIVGRAA